MHRVHVYCTLQSSDVLSLYTHKVIRQSTTVHTRSHSQPQTIDRVVGQNFFTYKDPRRHRVKRYNNRVTAFEHMPNRQCIRLQYSIPCLRVAVLAMPPFRSILFECLHVLGHDLPASLRVVNLLSPHALSNTVSQDFHFLQVYRPLSGALLTSFI